MIVPEHFSDVGFHLPSYQSSIDELMSYQVSLPSHQELRVAWDSIPGTEGIKRREQVEGVTLSKDFILLTRNQNLNGAPGKTTTQLGSDDLVVIGTTAAGEIRAIRIQPDPRMSRSESLSPGQPKERHDFVTPKVAIDIRLPEDSKITSIVFLKPIPNNKGGWRLQNLGVLMLAPKKLPSARN